MPTGYTHDITPSTTFRAFALTCARAFLWECRDSDAAIPEVRPLDPHAENRVAKAQAELDRICCLSQAEALSAADADHAERSERCREMREKIATQKAAYERMLEMVKAYVPPSPAHQEHANFMIEQITTSIQHDCVNMLPYYQEPVPRTAAQWHADEIKEAADHLRREQETLGKEQSQLAFRNEWVVMLMKAIDQVPVPA